VSEGHDALVSVAGTADESVEKWNGRAPMRLHFENQRGKAAYSCRRRCRPDEKTDEKGTGRRGQGQKHAVGGENEHGGVGGQHVSVADVQVGVDCDGPVHAEGDDEGGEQRRIWRRRAGVGWFWIDFESKKQASQKQHSRNRKQSKGGDGGLDGDSDWEKALPPAGAVGAHQERVAGQGAFVGIGKAVSVQDVTKRQRGKGVTY
jgi:hypothetical protein